LKGRRGRGTAAEDKPPVLGVLERGGQVRIWLLANVKQTTIRPLIEQTVQAGSVFHTDEQNIYNWFSEHYEHKTVNHSQGEYACDEDSDGQYEVHVNTMECFWSLLRPWLRVHWGLSQERLPYYLGFFEYLYNVRKRGHLALTGRLTLLLTT
jgi:transposase